MNISGIIHVYMCYPSSSIRVNQYNNYYRLWVTSIKYCYFLNQTAEISNIMLTLHIIHTFLMNDFKKFKDLFYFKYDISINFKEFLAFI